MTIDHISFNVPASSYDKVVTWYLATLAPLGYTKQHDIPGKACGLGPSPDKAKFWIGASDSDQATTSGIHIAFTAQDHDTVIRCYGEGIKAGGVPNGDPGLREMYHPNYFAAFVFDPVGNNIEFVVHEPNVEDRGGAVEPFHPGTRIGHQA